MLAINPFAILTLRYLPSEKILPSFFCKNTTTQSEQLICEDNYLSGLDLSLNEAHQQAREQKSNDEFKAIYLKQKAFIKERDKCKTTECLSKVMSEQLYFLDENISVISD